MNRRPVFVLSFFLWIQTSWSAMEFNGSTTFISIPDSTAQSFGSNDFAMMAWLYSTDSTAAQFVMAKDNETNRQFYAYVHADGNDAINQPGRVGLAILGGGGYFVRETANSVLTVNRWTHVVWQRDAGTIEIHLNGSQVSAPNTAGSGLIESGAIDDSPDTLHIGQREFTGSNLSYFGQIADIRIYNRALTDSEIQSLGQSRVSLVLTTTLNGWWRLDEGADGTVAGGATVIDRTGNASLGTPTNSPIWKASEWISYP